MINNKIYPKNWEVTKLAQKIQASEQFAQVASFLMEIIDTDHVVAESYGFLCVDPWTNEPLPRVLRNIDTTSFCKLFPMKSTSCGRHLRFFKENY